MPGPFFCYGAFVTTRKSVIFVIDNHNPREFEK